MSTGESPRMNRKRRTVAGGIGVALLAGGFATQAGPFQVGASSHREAPLIAGDPRADNTDVYAFVSPDAANSVTLIANWIPFEEPGGGPNFYTWADDTRYNIKIDNDGDALADLTYTWVFDTVTRDPNQQFLSNTGQVTSLTDPDLNVYQTYDLTVTNGSGVTTTLLGNGDGDTDPGDPIVAPSHAGAASMPDYATLRAQATYNLPSNGGKTYSGQADDPFFLDLRVFDLLYGANATEVGQDTLANYNVNTVALQVPKSALAIGGNETRNPVIGVWSTTERRSAQVADTPGTPDAQFVQVSRLGNPLVNEVVVPLSLKDAFNSISPDQDAGVQAVVDKVLDPILPKLIQSIYGVPAPATNRNDLFEIFLTGISKANAGVNGDPNVVLNVDLNSQDLNLDISTPAGRGGAAFRPSEMLRLNMSVPPAATPNRLGVLAGDVAGFPNGRRLTDDVVDIAIQAVEGAAQSGALVSALATIDSVDRNDRAFGTTFPYLALPHSNGVNLGVERTPRNPEFVSVGPERILETRATEGGQKGYTGVKPIPGQVVELLVTGLAGSMVPTDAKTVFLNLTAVNTVASGFVTVYPCGATRPLASSFNPIAGTITQSLVAAQVGTGGKVCVYTNTSTDLIADLAGYHPSTAAYTSVAPERLLETRTTETGGQKGYVGAKPADGQVITLKVTGVGTAAVPADAKAVFINVTSVNSDGAGWITAYPCGTARPNTSNVNLVPGLVRSNLVAATVGTGGNVCLYVSRGTDVVADIEGFVPASSSYVSTVPERVLETRAADGRINYTGSKPISGQTVEVKVTGFGNTKIPSGAGTVMLNLTVAESAPAGFVTVYPCGSPRPLASSINFNGSVVPNLVAAGIGDGGRVCIYTSADTHLVADIAGYFPGTVLAGA